MNSPGSSAAEERTTGARAPATRRLTKFLALSREDRVLLLTLWPLIVLVAALLRLLGYRRAVRLLSRRSLTSPVQDPVPDDSMVYALRLGRLARIAGRYAPTNGSCLRQSLLVWWILGRKGVPAELRIGVQTAGGFAAHAWVELGGLPVNDAPDVAERFVPFDGCLSARLVSSL